MLTLANPIANPDGYSTAGIVASPSPVPNFAPLTIATTTTPIPKLTPAVIVPATPPAIVDGVVTIDAPINVIPTTLVIEGITYTFTLTSPPPVGTFTVDNGQIKIGLRGVVPPVAIAYYSIPDLILTDFIPAPYPQICSQFPLDGELTWTLTWEEQPSASLRFITNAREMAGVISYFTATRSIDIYGVLFSPSGQVSITQVSLNKSLIPLIEVSVNLTGVNGHLLDRYTSLGISLTLPNCTAPPGLAENSPTSMTLQDVASRLGTSVAGASIAIDAQILTSPATPVNLSSLLDSNSIRSVGAFVDYHGSAIVLKQYGGVGQHNIIQAAIRSDIATSINAKIGSAPYYKTYDPLTKIGFGSNPNTPNTAVPPNAWQPRPQVTTTTTDGDPNASVDPYSGVQRDLSIVFDISGKRKRLKTTTLINGQPIREVETEYGYVAVAKDDAVLDATGISSLNGSWQQIENSSTDYEYNSLGYLIRVVYRGVRLARYRTENAQKPESLSVRIDPDRPDPGEVAQLQTFRFFYLPTSKIETLTLGKMSDYYDDIIAPTVSRTICLPDGSTATIPVADPSYVPPYFVLEKRVTEDSYSSIINPQSTALKPLPNLTTGKKVDFIERTTIRPRPTLSSSIVTSPPNPTEYTKSTDNYAASDGQFSNTLSIAESSIVSGRPTVAPNLGPSLELVTVPPIAATPLTPAVPFAVKSGLSGENTGYVTVGSMNFPSANSQSAALLAAQIDIDIINCKNSATTTMTIDLRPSMRPGDLINTRAISGRLITVTNSLKINGLVGGAPFITSTGSQIKIGTTRQTPVTIVNIPTRTTTLRL